MLSETPVEASESPGAFSDGVAVIGWVLRQLHAILSDPAGQLLLILAAIVIGLGVFQRWSRSRARRFWSGRVTGVVGRKGGGKSLFAVWQAYRQLRYPVVIMEGPNKGRKTYGTLAANFEVDVSGIKRKRLWRCADPPAAAVTPLKQWSDLLKLPPYTYVLLDEVGLWCPLRVGQTLPLDVAYILKQCRKIDIEIGWLDQDENNVAVGLRRQTDFMCEVRNLGNYHRAEFYDQRFYPPKFGVKPLWRIRYRRSPKWLRLYESKQLIRPADGIDVSAEMRELTALVERQRADSPPARAGSAGAPRRHSRFTDRKKATDPGVESPGPAITDPTFPGGPDSEHLSEPPT